MIENPKATEQDLVIHLLERDISKSLLDATSIKYVVVPLQDVENDDDFFAYYGNRQAYIDALDKLNYLKEINIGTSNIKIYENQSFNPLISLTNGGTPYRKIDYFQISPTEYRVNLNNFFPDDKIVFSEKFHPDWKIRVGDFNWTSSLLSKKYFYPDQQHSQNQFGLNEFQLNSEVINKNTKLTIYFAPQANLNLGLIVSMSTLMISIVIIIILVVFQKHESS